MKVLSMMLIVTILVLGTLAGCAETDGYYADPEAQRLNAQANLERAQAEAEAKRLEAQARADAERERAEAEAETQRVQARAEAEASLAATRQMERDAAHQRWMETLTTLGLVALPLSLAALGMVLLARRRQTVDPVMIALLEGQRQETRHLWHALAMMQRQRLPAGEPDQVIIYEERKG
jgi:hypothetical protein